MEKELITQFVCFETSGDNFEFISKWDQYAKAMINKQEIKLFQEIGINSKSKYLSQHKCYQEEFTFTFRKGKRSSRFPEIEMRIRQLGGYTVLQHECDHDSEPNENKIFVFLNDNENSLEEYRQCANYLHLNIYKAYFENCTHDYILEYFADKNLVDELITQLKLLKRHFEIGMYKECLLATSA